MPQDPHAHIDRHVLEMIEQSPVGAVPSTPSFQDALKRLRASHQAYADADHKGGFVTARSLAGRPVFRPENIPALRAGKIDVYALEANAAIFDRYVRALPEKLRAGAEPFRAKVVGRLVHHRHKADGVVIHDPVHALFLVPGAGPHPGLPGNYLYGYLLQLGADPDACPWAVHLHDNDDGAMLFDAPTLAGALDMLEEVLASAPYHLSELTAFGFRSN